MDGEGTKGQARKGMAGTGSVTSNARCIQCDNYDPADVQMDGQEAKGRAGKGMAGKGKATGGARCWDNQDPAEVQMGRGRVLEGKVLGDAAWAAAQMAGKGKFGGRAWRSSAPYPAADGKAGNGKGKHQANIGRG